MTSSRWVIHRVALKMKKEVVVPEGKLNVHLQNIMPGNRINFSGCDAIEIGAGSTTDSLFDTSANETVLPSDEMNIVVDTKRPFAGL